MMNRDEILHRLSDYLDGLLDESETGDAEKLITEHPDLLAEAARLRERLYRPYAVPAPADGMRQRILERHARRPLPRLLRYAAVFAAGVLSTLLLRAEPTRPQPESPPTVREAPAAPVAATKVLNRRVR